MASIIKSIKSKWFGYEIVEKCEEWGQYGAISMWEGPTTVTFMGEEFQEVADGCVFPDDIIIQEEPSISHEAIVKYSALLDKCTIGTMDRLDWDEAPRLDELSQFVRDKRRMENRLFRMKRQEEYMFDQLLQMCVDSSDVKVVKKWKRDDKLWHRYKSIMYRFIMLRYPKVRRLAELYKECCPIFKDVATQTVPIEAQPEMEEPHGFGTVQEDEKANVAILDQRMASVSFRDPSIRWSRYVSNDVVDDYKTLTDRWLSVGSFEWNTQHKQDELLYKVDNESPVFPSTAIWKSGVNTCDMPNLLPFRVHAYWRGDMEFKILVNSNKFQIGQLLVAFYYQPDNNLDMPRKWSIWSLSQMQHAVVSASASNSVTLYVPYKHVYPFLPCSRVIDQKRNSSVLNLGRLYIRVINPLRTTATGPKSCTGSVLVRFVNSEFTGMRHGSFFAQPEMLGIDTLLKTVNTVNKVMNMDNPPDVAPPTYVVPTASHSWCIGTNIGAPLHSLRLDARGQTQHPPACDAPYEMTVDFIKQQYGLMETLEWNVQHKRGQELLRVAATPLQTRKMGGDTYSATYVVPPVGVLAGMFMQWRGSLEYKFEVVASQFHTGRIMVGYIPGVTAGTDITLEKLRASPHMIFDLQEQREFTYEVPYISYAPWCVRDIAIDYIGQALPAPSTLCMYVYNPLVIMDGIPDTVYINMYIRGSKSFEVSVPVQPSFGLAWDTRVLFSDAEKEVAQKGYYPYYCGLWHETATGTELVFRWGTLSDQIAEFKPIDITGVNVVFTSIYCVIDDIRSSPGWTDKGEAAYVKFMVPVNTGSYWIGIPCPNEESAQRMSYYIYNKKLAWNDKKLSLYCIKTAVTSFNTYSKGNPAWIIKKVFVNIKDEKPALSTTPYVMVYPEGEERDEQVVHEAPTTLALTDCGMTFFGESFNDLKDLARRFQLYCTATLTEVFDLDASRCAFFFPVLPQGLALDIGSVGSIDQVNNRCREGVIPLLASAFRYYRGGIRFRIVFPKELESMIWIQHRPDRKLRSPTVQYCKVLDTSQGVYNHGYASYLQYCRVNNIVEFEVPYYNRTCYNWLQRPNLQVDQAHKWAYSLGEIVVGIQATLSDLAKFQNKQCTVYYALADDAQFSEWTGFSQLLNISNIPSNVSMAQPEGWLDGIMSSVVGSSSSAIAPIVNEATDRVIDETRTTIADLMTSVQTQLRQNPITMTMTFDTLQSFLSQLGHTLINPTPMTIVWSLLSLLTSFGLFAVTTVNWFIGAARQFVEEFVVRLRDRLPESTNRDGRVVVHPEGPQTGDGEIVSQWVGVLYTGLCTALSITCNKPKDLKSWMSTAVKDLGNITRSSNQVVVFIRNTFDVLRDIFWYVMGRSNNEAQLLVALDSDPEIIQNWAKEVVYLIDPRTKRDNMGNSTYNDRVFEAASFGQIIIGDIALELATKKNTSLIMKLFEKITNLKEELIMMGENPYIRKLPYTLYMYGPPGIGKSFLSTHLSAKLLKAASIKIGGKGLKCTINPQSDFWDQCDHQPVLEVDDLFAVKTPAALEKQLLTLFQVCSPIVLSPPKAALEEKKMRYNPEIFYINSNYDFPVFNDVNPKAVWRRRNVLIHAELNEVKRTKGCPHCEKDVALDRVDPIWLKDFHHLKFRLAEDVTDNNGGYGLWMSYEDLEQYLIEDFKENRRKEHANFVSRSRVCENTNANLQTRGETLLDIYDSVKQARLDNYKEVRERTLWTDLKKCYNILKEQAGSSVENALSATVLVRDISAVTYFSRACASPEAGGNPFEEDESLSFTQIDEMITEIDCSDEHVEYVYDKTGFDKLVNCDILTKRDIVREQSKMAILGDNGITFTEWVHIHCGRFELLRQKGKLCASSILDLFRISFKSDDPYCKHVAEPIRKMVFADGRIKSTYSDDLQRACNGICIFNSELLKYYWHKIWLDVNPVVRVAVWRRNPNVPEYFKDVDCDLALPPNFISQWYAELKAWWLTRVTPIVRNCYSWFVSWAPSIFAVLLGCLVLAQPVMLGVENYYAMQYAKQSAYNAGWQQDSFGESHRWSYAESAVKYDVDTPKAYNAVNREVSFSMPQGCTSQVDVVERLIQRQTIYFIVMHGDIEIARFRALVINKRQVLSLRHYTEALLNYKRKFKDTPEDTQFFVEYAQDTKQRLRGGRLPVNLLNLDYQCYGDHESDGIPNSNFMVITMPPSFPEGRDLTKFMAPMAMHKYANTTGRLVVPGEQSYVNIRINYRTNHPHVIASTSVSNPVYMNTMYTYEHHAPGMCGSVLLAENLEKPIVGFHVAGMSGSNSYGMAEPLCAEMFGTLPQPRLSVYTAVADIRTEPCDIDEFPLDTVIYPYGKVPSQVAQAQSGRSLIGPSLIHGCVPVRTEPNPIRQGDLRLPPGVNPLYAGCRKHGLVLPEFSSDDIRDAKKDLSTLILNVVQPIRQEVGVVPLQDVVCGNPAIPEFEAINMSSSAGFPLNSRIYEESKSRQAAGKRWCFDIDMIDGKQVLKGFHPELKRLYEVTQGLRKKGIKPVTIFNDCLKDTTLPKEKCKIPGKTRIFSISPIQYTLAFREYFLDFMGAYRRTRLRAEHGIGITCDGPEWVQLAHHLSTFGSHIVTGDYSNYGPGLHLSLAEAACEIILEWYEMHGSSKEDNDIRAILASELIGAYHLCGEYLYKVPCGIPSGSPITDVLNSLINCLYVRLAYKAVSGKPLSTFTDYVALVVYGDDLIMNVHPDIIDTFNGDTIRKYFKEYGMSFTDQDKSGASISVRTLRDATFLKRGFKQHPKYAERILAPLDQVSVEGCLNWINIKNDKVDNTLQNALQSLQLAYGHGPEYYNKLCDVILKACRSKGFNVIPYTWEELDCMFWKA